MLSRDHSVITKAHKSGQKDAFNDVFRYSIQNLVLFYPVFLYFINEAPKDGVDVANQGFELFVEPQVDYEQFEQEVKAYVAQLIYLIQTMMNLCPKKA
jgi:hypothetical protein